MTFLTKRNCTARAVITLYFLCSSLISNAQTRYSEYLLQSAKHQREEFRSQCNQLGTNRSYSKKEIRSDKKLISFLNEFYNRAISVKEVIDIASKQNLHALIDSINLGGATRYDLKLRRKHTNLRPQIIFTTFQDKIVYKKITLETSSKSYCLDSLPHQYLAFNDISYLERYCFQYIDFPLQYLLHQIPAYADTIYALKSNNSPYLVPPADSKTVCRAIYDHYTEYKAQGILNSFKSEVKNRDTALLFSLLYSPNHIVGLHAMEALIYLQETAQINLPGHIVQQMERLHNSNIILPIGYFDVTQMRTYKSARITTPAIVMKYQRFLASED